MRGGQISTIYFYFISAVALILLVIGLYHSVTFVLNITQYDEYPLRYARNCESYPATPILMQDRSGTTTVESTPAYQEKINDEQKKKCEEELVFERKRQKLDDLRNMAVFTAAGLLLFATHFPIALRRSNSSA